ncbi:MAG: hypothetical protein NZL89_06645, partial [Leptospiraceae bacterium]|nr:hypothetical protein [Leptospiraceae bacterium]
LVLWLDMGQKTARNNHRPAATYHSGQTIVGRDNLATFFLLANQKHCEQLFIFSSLGDFWHAQLGSKIVLHEGTHRNGQKAAG